MEMMAPYTRRVSRQYPGMFVILLDQSASMGETVPGTGATKAQFARSAVNEIIYSMADRVGVDSSTGSTKRLAYFSVLGYNDRVYPLLDNQNTPLGLDFLADRPPGMEQIQLDIFDTNTKTYMSQTVTRPSWITRAVAEGQTQMGKAMNEAHLTIERWLQSQPERMQASRNECFPPVVINITDAEDNGGADPIQASEAIRSMGTLQGACLVFTCHIGKVNDTPTVFPASEYAVSNLHPMATKMFQMSSIIPDPLLPKAAEMAGVQSLPYGARAFIYNANADMLVSFLKLGTIGTGGLE